MVKKSKKNFEKIQALLEFFADRWFADKIFADKIFADFCEVFLLDLSLSVFILPFSSIIYKFLVIQD